MENQQKNSAPENNSDNRNSNNNKKKPSKTVVIWIVSILLTFMIWQGITAIQQSKRFPLLPKNRNLMAKDSAFMHCTGLYGKTQGISYVTRQILRFRLV